MDTGVIDGTIIAAGTMPVAESADDAGSTAGLDPDGNSIPAELVVVVVVDGVVVVSTGHVIWHGCGSGQAGHVPHE